MQIDSKYKDFLPKSYLFTEKSEQLSDLKQALALFDRCLSPLTKHWVSKENLCEKPKHFKLRDGLISPRQHNHFDYITQLERSDYGYLQYASAFWLGTFVIDIDANVANSIESTIFSSESIPLPNLIVRNPANGHVQLYYCLKNSVCIDEKNKKRYSKKAVSLLNAVKTRLKELLGGDFAHKNSIAKNPHGKMWDVSTMRTEPYHLAELARVTEIYTRPIKSPFLFTKHLTKKAVKLAQNIDVGQRNDWLFETVRHYAYKLFYKYGKDWSKRQFENCLFEFTNELNLDKCKIPLVEREVREITKSITRFCYERYIYSANTNSQLSQIAKALGKKGGKAKGKAYERQRRKALSLFRKGLNVSEIVNSTRLSKSLVYDLIKRYKSRIASNRKTIVKANTDRQIQKIPNTYQYGCASGGGIPFIYQQDCEAILPMMGLKHSFFSFKNFMTIGVGWLWAKSKPVS